MNNQPENDPTWDLLGKASKQEASPMFSRDVMRAIRLEEQERTPWWKKLLQPAPVFGTLAIAAACVALVLSSQQTPQTAPSIVDNSDADIEEIATLYFAESSDDELTTSATLLASNDIMADFDLLMGL